MKSFFRMVLLLLVLLLVALVSALTAMRLAIHGSEVAVPTIVGLSPAEAQRALAVVGLQMVIERQYYSPQVPEGKILSQLPEPGTNVRRGWQVRVSESLGPQRIAIPDVLGQSERAADFNIRRRGLEIAGVAQIAMPGTPPDQVLSQNPLPNASEVSAPKISLLVSGAPQPQAFVMPNFAGQSLGSVSAQLAAAGMRLGDVTFSAPAVPDGGAPVSGTAPVQPSPASIIVMQSPAPGQQIFSASTVNFQVRP
jgi:eukaryotic-like serine/threonine-protein kinase